MPVDKSSAKRMTSEVVGTIKVKGEAAVLAACTVGRTHATVMTPMDLGHLVNSQYLRVMETANGWTGMVGYTARYAMWVHNASGKLKGQPRAHFGKTREGVEFGGGSETGDYWDPDGEPKFLKKGFEDNKAEIDAVVLRAMKL